MVLKELFSDFSICDTLSIGSKTTKSLSNSFPKQVLEKIIRLNKVFFKNLIFLVYEGILNDKRNYRK